MKWRMGLLLFVAAPEAAQAVAPPKPLFSSDAPIQLAIRGPVGAIAHKADKSTAPEAATLSLASPAESHSIRLSARGLSRRNPDVCTFPPLRVEFAQRPAVTSLFTGQGRLKLVTHCRSAEGFQQHLLLEYAAYRMYNIISPLSHRVRLATVDYIEPNGRALTTRWGFFIEDLDDVARRNGLSEARVGDRILATQLEPRQAGRVALFQYMVGNLDWSMRAGPQGEPCCHNARLLAGPGRAFVPIAYDFDYTGVVDAPYAIPPKGVGARNVRQRVYRGYCMHNQATLAAAAEFRARRPAIEAVFGQVPGMAERTRSKAFAYLRGFFDQIASDETVRSQILKGCLS